MCVRPLTIRISRLTSTSESPTDRMSVIVALLRLRGLCGNVAAGGSSNNRAGRRRVNAWLGHRLPLAEAVDDGNTLAGEATGCSEIGFVMLTAPDIDLGDWPMPDRQHEYASAGSSFPSQCKQYIICICIALYMYI